MSSSTPTTTIDSADVEPSGFMHSSKRRAGGLAQVVAASRPTKPATARGRIAAGKPKKGRVQPLGPTPERLAKGDIVRSTGGSVVAEGGLERLRRTTVDPTKANEVLARLHRRCSLDHDPGMNDRMYEAGKKYERLIHMAGLGGIGAQNLLALRGEGNAPHMMPASEAAANARGQLRKAWVILSPKVAAVVHALVVDGRDPEEVGREVSTYRSKSECTTAAMTALRIALWSLVEARWA